MSIRRRSPRRPRRTRAACSPCLARSRRYSNARKARLGFGLEQDLERLAGGGKGERAGDVRGCTQTRATVELERGVRPRRGTQAADAAVGLGISDVLERVDRRHAEVAVAVLREVEF